MAATPDETATGVGRAPDPEAVLSAAEAAHLATRETVRLDVRGGRLANRETVRLPIQRGRSGPRQGRRRAPLALAAVVAAAWAALVSFAPVALVLWLAQLAEGGGSPGGALQLGLAGWLLGHGVPLETDNGTLGSGAARTGRARRVAPGAGRRAHDPGHRRPAERLGLPRAGRRGGHRAVVRAARRVLAAALLSETGPQASAARAGLTLAGFGALAALIGTARSSGAIDTVAARVPGYLRDGVRAGVVVALVLFGAGAAAAGISIALGGGEASDVLAAYRTGVAGQAGVTLVCLAYAPNAAIWAVAYLVGPGFAIGTDSVVRVTEVTVGGLPALPIFAGLPAGPVGGAGAALVGVPVIAGMVGGWLMTRPGPSRSAARMPVAGRAGPRWPALLGAAVVAGLVAGALLGLAAIVSSGSLGGGRLADLGPVGWQVAAAATGLVTVGTVVGAAAARAFAGQPDG